MNLCIDIGNSLVKTAVFSGQDIVSRLFLTTLGIDEVNTLASEYPGIKHVIICSVKPDDSSLADKLRQRFGHIINFTENTPVPVENLYETTETLGKDRLAGVIGANNIFPSSNVLIIDAGTAITFDVVDSHNRYIGGNISPGIGMRFRALHEFTGKLPLVEPQTAVSFPLLARKTKDSIIAGVQNGIIFETDSYISLLKESFEDLKIILTGGYTNFFDKKLKNTIFVDPDLILKGLNRILIYNVENK